MVGALARSRNDRREPGVAACMSTVGFIGSGRIAGDDPGAKQAVTAFLDSRGYGTVDAGPLAESWRQQPGTPVYGAPYGPFERPAGTPASAETIRAALAAATR